MENDIFLTFSAPTPQNSQKHSHNTSAVTVELFECVLTPRKAEKPLKGVEL